MRLLLRLRTLEVTRARLLEASYEISVGISLQVSTLSASLVVHGVSMVCNRTCPQTCAVSDVL